MDKVEQIASLVLKGLKEKNLIVLKADEEKVLQRMQEAILTDLRAEDALDKEVEGILNAHAGAIDDEGADYRKMFRMLKNKLVKERGIII